MALYITVIFLLPVFRSLIQQNGMRRAAEAAMVAKLTVYGLVFEKMRTVDMRAMPRINVGDLTSNITNDVMRITIAIYTVHQAIVSPTLIALFLGILIYNIGYFAPGGLFIILLIMLVNVLISKLIGKLTGLKLVLNSTRNQEINFAIGGIKTLKFNAWEEITVGILDKIRRKERRVISKIIFFESFSNVLTTTLPTLAGFVCIMLYNSLDSRLNIADVFFIITLFNLLVAPLRVFVFGIMKFFEARVSLKRISKMLLLPDMPDSPENFNLDSISKGCIEIKNASFAYNDREYDSQIDQSIKKSLGSLLKKKVEETKNFNKYDTIVKNINISVDTGQLVMVVGPVGSGKSTLLKSIMGLLHRKQGEVHTHGKVGYIPQESFLINHTFRENVTFGNAFDYKTYRKALKICQLEPDLKVIPGGEMAEIGEKGLNLSGGQKQRVSIARTVYADPDIVLMDDSLSALDPQVGKSIFEQVVLKQFVQRGKTVILCTHILKYLDRASKVVFLEKGEIVFQGTFRDLLKTNSRFESFVSADHKDLKSTQSKLKKSKFDFDSRVFDEFPAKLKDVSHSNHFINLSMGEMQSSTENSLLTLKVSSSSVLENSQSFIVNNTDQNLNIGKLNKTEQHIKGDIKKGVFWKYFRSGGIFLFVTCLFFYHADSFVQNHDRLLGGLMEPKHLRLFRSEQRLLLHAGIRTAYFGDAGARGSPVSGLVLVLDQRGNQDF